MVGRAEGAATVHERHRRGLELLCARYAQYAATPPAGPVVEVAVRRWTGWSATPLD